MHAIHATMTMSATLAFFAVSTTGKGGTGTQQRGYDGDNQNISFVHDSSLQLNSVFSRLRSIDGVILPVPTLTRGKNLVKIV